MKAVDRVFMRNKVSRGFYGVRTRNELGAERLVNGDFSQGSTNWTVSNADATHIATFAAGTLRFQSDTTTPQLTVAQSSVLEVGREYQITVVTSSYVSGSIKSDAFTTGNLSLASGLGTFTARAVALSTAFSFTRGGINVDITIDSMSVKPINAQ